MTSSWDSYYIVFLSAVLSLGIPAFLAMISLVFFPRGKRKSAKTSNQLVPKASRTALGQRINVRFFLAVNAALVLLTLVLALIPCVTTLQSENHHGHQGLMTGLISIVTISGFAVLGLLYSIRKGDMSWLSTYNTEDFKTPVASQNSLEREV